MPGLIDRLYRNLVIRGYEDGLHGREIHTYWAELERTQWLPRPELLALQLRALRQLVAHAAQHCPYYRDDWQRRGLALEGLQSLEDFSRWPLIDREVIRENRLAMRSQAEGMRLFSKATGGSSGVPLHFDQDVPSYERKLAAWSRGYDWAGAGPGTKQSYLWGTALEGQPWRQRLKTQLYNRLYRREILSCFDLSEATVGPYLARLERRRPHVLVAYTNALYAFARMIRERGATPYSPRAIVVGAEKLHDFQRQLIEQVFQAPVFETYGSREFTLIAAECDRHTGLHLSMEYLLVEIVDDQGRPVPEGVEGNIAITDLYNYGMPFVRYLNGDRAIAATTPCSCGRGLATIAKVIGRRLDILPTPDGRQVPGEFFPHLLKDFDEVSRFQVLQEALSEVRLRVVLSSGKQARLSEIARQASAVLGPRVRFSIEPVADIPLTGAGKLQVVVSRLGDEVAPPTTTF